MLSHLAMGVIVSALSAPVGLEFTDAAPVPKLVTGRLLRVQRSMSPSFRQRFQIQTNRGTITEYEFLSNGLATRNEQPARLIDLQPGDHMVLYQLDPENRTVVRIDARSE